MLRTFQLIEGSLRECTEDEDASLDQAVWIDVYEPEPEGRLFGKAHRSVVPGLRGHGRGPPVEPARTTPHGRLTQRVMRNRTPCASRIPGNPRRQSAFKRQRPKRAMTAVR